MTFTALHAVPAARAGSAPLSVQAEAWLERLPAPVRVHGVAAHAPDMANRLAATWHDVASTASLLETILVESVMSLPVAIAAELLRLYEYHAHCCVIEAPNTTWELPSCGFARAAAAGRRA
jgi:hypothetical protein